MSTAPPIARDRLIGLARVSRNLVSSMEDQQRIPPRMTRQQADQELAAAGSMIRRLADRDIITWLASKRKPTRQDVFRAATVVADRLCGAVADPIIRNAQEKRQLGAVKRWLVRRGYKLIPIRRGVRIDDMMPGTFAFRLPVRVPLTDSRTVNVPVDAAIMPRGARQGELPLLVEAKSAGDFTNVNKRRKEEAQKIAQFRRAYGQRVQYILFLCGYFDSGYLGYEAAEGIDWVWEHRIDDLAGFGL
jgi:hypothetical protein